MNKETTMIKIDKDVPVPTAPTGGQKAIYPWRDMKPGDSFFAPNRTTGKDKSVPTFNTLIGKRTHPGSAWATRTVTENGIRGVRVWRLT